MAEDQICYYEQQNQKLSSIIDTPSVTQSSCGLSPERLTERDKSDWDEINSKDDEERAETRWRLHENVAANLKQNQRHHRAGEPKDRRVPSGLGGDVDEHRR